MRGIGLSLTMGAVALLFAVMVQPHPAMAKGVNKGTAEADICKTKVPYINQKTGQPYVDQSGNPVMVNYPCGAIVYANKGGYYVKPVAVEARGSNNQETKDPTYNKACADYKRSFRNEPTGLQAGEYVTFIVPASCAYKLSIDIVAGRSKDRDLWLTPGCVIETSTDGTTTSNEWHMKTYYSDKAKAQTADLNKLMGTDTTLPKDPVDADGHACGRQGKM
ncbi:MAG: hypothetical protein GC201_13710 [Alphaproteobacteria bacterium]|nr:hypothetical protein [Alphaproteobacteria bacterium]